jgi:hypothetical protein
MRRTTIREGEGFQLNFIEDDPERDGPIAFELICLGCGQVLSLSTDDSTQPQVDPIHAAILAKLAGLRHQRTCPTPVM